MMRFTINTDGGARGNPGPAGVGFTIKDDAGRLLKEGGAYVGETTNNWAEYEAVIRALAELKKLIPEAKRSAAVLDFVLDSELVVKQLSGEYQIKDEPLQLQFMRIWNAKVAHFPNMTFRHVARAENAAADKLVNAAIDSHAARLV